MIFTHHANKDRVDNVNEWKYDPIRTYENDQYSQKPKGIWLSVDDDWRRWCHDSDCHHFVDGKPEILFHVDTNKIRVIDTVDELDFFFENYVLPNGEPGGDFPGNPFRVNWTPLTKGYSGIMIAPYLWERQDYWFYMSWDCASACIWDLDVITMVRRIA